MQPSGWINCTMGERESIFFLYFGWTGCCFSISCSRLMSGITGHLWTGSMSWLILMDSNWFKTSITSFYFNNRSGVISAKEATQILSLHLTLHVDTESFKTTTAFWKCKHASFPVRLCLKTIYIYIIIIYICMVNVLTTLLWLHMLPIQWNCVKHLARFFLFFF